MKKHYLLAVLSALSLSACQSGSMATEDWPDDWKNTTTTPSQSSNVPQKATTSSTASSKPVPTSSPLLPPTYYLEKGTPVSHQSSDTAWVSKQSSSEYTIELASGNAPSVAQTLQQAPKNERMAQVKSNGESSSYVGLYGTYPTKQAAEAALAKLPANLKSNASVESWSNVQNKVETASDTSDESSIAPPDVTDTSN